VATGSVVKPLHRHAIGAGRGEFTSFLRSTKFQSVEVFALVNSLEFTAHPHKSGRSLWLREGVSILVKRHDTSRNLNQATCACMQASSMPSLSEGSKISNSRWLLEDNRRWALPLRQYPSHGI
jgi:hypothetical protein